MTSSSFLNHDLPIIEYDADLVRARRQASCRRFPPTGTVRCVGIPLYRTRLARDLGLLLDLDDDVDAWRCLPASIEVADHDGVIRWHVPDFSVRYGDGSECYLDAGGLDFQIVAPGLGWGCVCEDEILAEPAISNAREMLRYGRRVVPLGDRIRLLAYLEEAGTMTLVEAATAMRESHEPIGAVIALALQRIVKIAWRESRITPETQVEAIR